MKKFLFIITALFCINTLTACSNEIDLKNNQKMISDDPPIIMLDNDLYIDTGYINSDMKNKIPDGKILSSVDKKQIPQKDKESNFGTGYFYKYGKKDTINVKIEGKWMIFVKKTKKHEGIPNGVANFKAKIKDIQYDIITADLILVPDNFKWIFKDMKTISINMESKTEKGKKVKLTEKLTGKIIQIWFDGELSEDKVVELDHMYKIKIMEDK